MKKILNAAFLLPMILLVPAFIHGQSAKTDTAKAKESPASSSTTAADNSGFAANVAADNASDKEPTGVIRFDTLLNVPIYTSNRVVTARTAIVDRVVLDIKDGYIIDIQVFAGNRVFTNTKALISVNSKRFSSQSTDWLVNKNDGDEYIIMQKAVFYDNKNSFFPEDGTVILTRKVPSDTLVKNVSVNTVVDLRLYTDALAALGNEPNGIFQTNVKLKQFLHRKHYPNGGARIFQYIKVDFTASKIDSKFSFVDSSFTLSRSQLFQKSKTNAEASINLFTSWLGRKTISTYYVDFGGGINSVKLARLKDTISINVPDIFIEAGVSLRNSSNIGFDFFTRYIFQYSPQTDFNHQDIDVKFLKLGFEAFWNPFKGAAASRVFGRLNLMMGLSKAEKKNNFTQVQIGYSTLLSKAIGKK